MSKQTIRACLIATALFGVGTVRLAHGHEHTHIGRNADALWGTADDDQLWIFASDSQPQWDTLPMIPTGEFFGDKQLYVADLDCWHSAHPPTGVFQLGGATQEPVSDWRIGIKRIGYSDSVSFWMEEEATGSEILAKDGDIYNFGLPKWFADMYNENGQFGAYGFHVHTEFLALANGAGETFSATFTAVDAGATDYLESAPYTFTFETIPEPATILLLCTGAFCLPGIRPR